MKKLRSTLFFLIPALCLAGTRPEPGWVTLKPATPVSFSVSMPSAAHKIEGRDEWRAVDAAGSIFSAAYGLYTEPTKITDPVAFMRMMVDRLSANTQSKVAYLVFFKYQHVPACEFKLVNLAHHQVGVGRYFLVNQWFYFLDLSTSDKDFRTAQANKFFESFQIINPQLKDFQPGP